MSIGMLMLVLALFALAGLGVTHKIADFKKCRPSAVTVALFFWAATVLWSYTLFYKVLGTGATLFPPFTGKAVLVAALCGTCAGFGILTFQIGVRYGPITTSWLIVNLSTLVPAVLSLVIYQEWKGQFKWQHPAALVLVLASVLLLWRDKLALKRGKGALSKEPQNVGGGPGGQTLEPAGRSSSTVESGG